MKLNWKVRLNNPVWWAQVVIAFFAPILGYVGLNWTDLTTWQSVGNLLVQAISNPVIVVLVIVSVASTLNDPTTKGLSDSDRAMDYIKPKE